MLCFSCVLYLEYRATVSRLYMPLYHALLTANFEIPGPLVNCELRVNMCVVLVRCVNVDLELIGMIQTLIYF
jgi:hypothetical protein